MKKLVFFAFIITLLLIPVVGKTIYSEQKENYQVIPDEAIRLRILANSDDEADQEIKHLVRDQVNKHISEWVADISDIDEARKLIQDNIPAINEIVAQTLKKAGSNADYQVEYGENITFPAKLYGSYLYPAGEYEAVLITLGKGDGANWWCVLFPPLCFLDFSNGTTVSAEASTVEQEEEEELEEHPVKIKFFLFEWLGWS